MSSQATDQLDQHEHRDPDRGSSGVLTDEVRSPATSALPRGEPAASSLILTILDEHGRRWRAGDRVEARDYLARHPSIAARGEDAATLVYQEFILRESSGQPVDFGDFLRKFPEYARELELLRQADDWLGHGAVSRPSHRLERVGDCVLMEPIARSGMGVVYKAWQEHTGRIVALKMISAGASATPAEKERLRLEARATARLKHPNIVTVHHVGEHEGQPFFVMEYVEGQTLAALIREHPLSARDAARYLHQVAEAVHHAHLQGILHRDLKPSNIIIDCYDKPQVADFGLARLIIGDSRLTLTGEVLGTPSFMPPEQAGGKKDTVGPGSDVYGLGATLYAALTGRPPFQAETPLETLRQVVHTETVPPRLLNNKRPRDLETICLKCLQKDPPRRYPDARELADDLRRFLEDQPIRARRDCWWERGLRLIRRRPFEMGLAAVSLVALISLVALVFFLLWHWTYDARQQLALAEERASHEKTAAEARAARQVAEWQEFRSLASGVTEKRTSRPLGWTWSCLDDLTRAAQLTIDERERTDLRREAAICMAGVDIRKQAAWKMPVNTQVDRLTFSPDGRRLAMAQLRGVIVRQVRLVDLATGHQQDLVYPGPIQFDAKDTGGGCLAFSPDGRWLVLGTQQGDIYVWDTARPRARRLDLRGAHQGCVRGLAFDPDGMRLNSCSEDRTLRCWDIPSGWKNVGIAQLERGINELAVSPDGTTIACCTTLGLICLDATRAFSSKNPSSWKRRDYSCRSQVVGFSPDGRLLATTDDQQIVLLDPGSLQLILTLRDPELDNAAHLPDITHLQFNADGSLLLSSAWDRTVKLWEVATGRLLAVSRELAAEREIVFAAFRPDGRRLAVSNATQTVVYELDGLQEQTITARHAEAVRAFDFAPDGKALACVTASRHLGSGHLGSLAIWDFESGRFQRELEISGQLEGSYRGSVSFQRDGELLAFSQSTREFSVTRLTGHALLCDQQDPARQGVEIRTRKLQESPMSLVFSRDGQTLWTGAGTRLASWRMPDLALATEWRNDRGAYLKGRAGIVSLAAGREWVVAGSSDGSARVFRIGDGRQPMAEWPVPGGLPRSLALNKDESFAILGSDGGTVRIVRVPDGQTVADLKGHTDVVTSVALSPDDHLLATASLDRTLRLWQRRGDSFQELVLLQSPTGGVVQVRFHPAGRILAFLVKDECAIRLWHLDRLEHRLDSIGLGWR